MSVCKSFYGINEVSDLTGISAFTIRYYDKCGFFPDLIRNRRGVRSFTNEDIDRLYLVDALRKSGLSIEGIQYFVKLAKASDHATEEMLKILETQQTALEYQYAELEECLERLRNATLKMREEVLEGGF